MANFYPKKTKKGKILILMCIFLNNVPGSYSIETTRILGVLGSYFGSAEGVGRGLARNGPPCSKHYKKSHICHFLGSDMTLEFLFGVVGCLFYRNTLYARPAPLRRRRICRRHRRGLSSREYLQAWQNVLATRGLHLNQSKLQVWNPHALALPPAFLASYPDTEITTEGFKVCGLPLDQADATDPQDYAPLGDSRFTERFLEEAREATLRRLRVLTTFVHNMGPHTETLHVALRIARVNLQARHVHLYRYCDREIIHRWTGLLDTDIRLWLASLLDVPLDSPHALIILQTPVGQGGLGFLNQQFEAALHLLQALLPSVEELPRLADDEHPSARLIAETLDYLEHHAGVPLRPQLLSLQPHRMGSKLRDRLYEARRHQLHDLCPWLQPPGLPSSVPGQPDITWSWQIQVNMAWYTASGFYLLQEEPLRFAIQKHLGLPLFHTGQRCSYTPLTTGRRCYHQLGTYSDHVFTSAQGPSLRRHNRIRDTWIQLCRKAGWHTDAEQLVTIVPSESKRADFVTLTPDGHRIACDVMVTASPTPWDAHGPHLDTSAAAKATSYRTVSEGLTHDKAKLILLIHDAHNLWLSPGALRLLHRLVQAQAKQTVPPSAMAWGRHHMTASLEAASSLLHVALLAAWTMHAACGCMR